jgi:hypothetical protein
MYKCGMGQERHGGPPAAGYAGAEAAALLLDARDALPDAAGSVGTVDAFLSKPFSPFEVARRLLRP